MNLRRAGSTRRWQSAIAVVAALSLFVALVAGASLRPKYSADALPEPATWTHATPMAQAHAGRPRHDAAAQASSQLGHGFVPRSTPTSNKTFLSMWMTRELPASENPAPALSGWFALPAAFSAAELQSDRAHWTVSAFAATPVDRHTSAQLCVIRC